MVDVSSQNDDYPLVTVTRVRRGLDILRTKRAAGKG